MIQWNNGLSIGVKTLDDDHKKLLEIINSLSEAIDKDEEIDVFEGIFSNLEEYVQIHFDKEEAFLKKCNYEDYSRHKKQHEVFADEIPRLKEKFFSTDNYVDAKDISVFLTDWLVNHIINEDMHLVSTFEECGISEKNRTNERSWFSKLTKEIMSRFDFTKRMLISALIPMLGMLIFGSIIVWSDYKHYKEVDNISKITHIAFDVNELTHAFQIERGLSGGYISARTDKFKDSLDQQRKLVNNAKEVFINNIESIKSKEISIIMPYIEIFRRDIVTLNNIRKMIDDKSVSKIQEMKFYNNIIKNLLSIPQKIILINTNKDISYSISTLSSILNIKEALGQERALGTIIIEEKSSIHQEYKSFLELLGTRATYHNIFEQTATLNHQSIINRIFSTPVASQISEYRDKLLRRDYKDIDSRVWFDLSTEHINDIKVFLDHYLQETDDVITKHLDGAVNKLVLWFIYIVLILLTTRFIIYLFEKSNKDQFFTLTEAMNHIAHGGRSLRLNSGKGNDDISQIYKAYELTRQKLLKGDIFTQLYQSQEMVKLKNEKRENIKLEEMAFVDPLTGVTNRRKYEELSKTELDRTLRYKNDLSFLMLDIDNFKNINDTYGHAAGDEVLIHFSSICKEIARTLDIVARIGGEEFVIMLPETDRDGAYTFAERLREKVFNSSAYIEDKEIKYTVSIGISLCELDKDSDVNTILQRADKALYRAKESGRNKTVVI